MGAVAYEERILKTVPYRGYVIRVVATNLHMWLGIGVKPEHIEREKELTKERIEKLGNNWDYFDRAAARFHISDYQRIKFEGTTELFCKNELEAFVYVNYKDVMVEHLKREIDELILDLKKQGP